MKHILKLIAALMIVLTTSNAVPGVHGKITSIEISIDNPTIEADGNTFATVTLILKDEFNAFVTNANIQPMKITNGLDTDAIIGNVYYGLAGAGKYTFTVKSNIVETVDLYAVTDAVASDGISYSYTSGKVIANFIPVALPNGVNLVAGKVKYITSVYDDDYAPYTTSFEPATLERPVIADGVADQLINMQGYIPNNDGIEIEIPYTSEINTILPGYKAAYNVLGKYTEDNTSRRVYLEYTQQRLTSSSGFVKAKIYSKNDQLPAKKLDINVGIGNGSDTILINSNTGESNKVYGVRLANFTIAINSSGDTGEVQARTMVGIPDRSFGVADGNGQKDTHMFLYLPVVSATTGKTWLSNNLGANYADLNNASFNLVKQAVSKTDKNAYGSLFQWGRKSEGHELTDWGNGRLINSPVWYSYWDSNDISGKFVLSRGNWKRDASDTLWNSESSESNACPVGYRVPTSDELLAEISTTENSGNYNHGSKRYGSKRYGSKHNKHAGKYIRRQGSSTTAFNSALKLTTVGVRSKWDVYHTKRAGFYWTSDTSYYNYSKSVYFDWCNIRTRSLSRAHGASLRCIKD